MAWHDAMEQQQQQQQTVTAKDLITCLPTNLGGVKSSYHNQSRNVQYMGALSEMTGPPIEVRNATVAREKAYRENLRNDIKEREKRREEKRRNEEAEKNIEFEELVVQQWKKRNERTNYHHHSNGIGLAVHPFTSPDASVVPQLGNNNSNSSTSSTGEATTTTAAVPVSYKMGNVDYPKEGNDSSTAFIHSSSYPAEVQKKTADSRSLRSSPAASLPNVVSVPVEDFDALNKLCHELILEQKLLREEVEQLKYQLEQKETTNEETDVTIPIDSQNQIDRRRKLIKTTATHQKTCSNLCEKGAGNRHRPSSSSIGFGSSTQRGLGL